MSAKQSTSRQEIRIGDRFDYLTAMGDLGLINKHRRWLCVCRCGKNVTATASNLRHGHVRSCGCRVHDTWNAKPGCHGESKKKGSGSLYVTWQSMMSRCYNPNASGYALYGGRGISVCERWRGKGGFINFRADMGRRPPGTTLDRVDTNGNYEPGNCRWGTAKEQGRNKRTNRLIAFNGRTQTLVEWSEECGISTAVIRYRLKRGWGIEQALTTPLIPKKESKSWRYLHPRAPSTSARSG